MLQSNNNNLKIDINQEISKAFQNVNYSQWERQKQTLPKKPSPSTASGTRSNSKLSQGTVNADHCSSNCNHKPAAAKQTNKIVFKSKRQLQEEEAQKNILKAKIKFTKESIEELRQREVELIKNNKSLIGFIDKTETDANKSVDGILRKYEKYQELLKTITKKHEEEAENEKRLINELKKNYEIELPKYEASSNQVENELKNAQDLSKLLSIYKNQEYPEKLLQINNLRKKLDDLKKNYNEEQNYLLNMINTDKQQTRSVQIESTKSIATNLSSKAMEEMHYSIKEMALDNKSIKSEIEFYKNLLIEIKTESGDLEIDVNDLKKDSRRNKKTTLFGDVFKEKPICTPDMEVSLDLSTANKEKTNLNEF